MRIASRAAGSSTDSRHSGRGVACLLGALSHSSLAFLLVVALASATLSPLAGAAGPATGLAPLPAPVLTFRTSSPALVDDSITAVAGGWFAIAYTSPDGECALRFASLMQRVPKARTSDEFAPDSYEACDGQEGAWEGMWLAKGLIAFGAWQEDTDRAGTIDHWLESTKLPSTTGTRDLADWVDGAEGCATAAAAGGGLFVWATLPNLWSGGGADCAGAAETVLHVMGGTNAKITLQRGWQALAVGNGEVLVGGVDANGRPNRMLALIGLDGSAKALPAAVARTIRSGIFRQAWLTPDGIVVDEDGSIVAPGWRVGGASSATVAEGRLVYAKEGVLRVRRIRDGVDRPLLKLAAGHVHVLAGSFGIAVVDSTANTIDVHRIAWKTIDQTLPA